ncbi:MAG: hypothetical protein NT023_17380 [Armatimonadetes bacterium]|nr:hypothetical protein [Armatimonadota bacterium]
MSISLRYEWQQRRLPIFLIVDDPAPCLNLAYYEQYFEKHTRDVPNSFTAAWADVVQEFGVRGKFSVLPIPAAIGRIDRPLPDVAPHDQAEFLRIIRERVSPQMDINIEFLTHFLAWDIRRDRPLDYTEKTMSPFTNRDHLTEYFMYGLRILDNVGLNPTGATSPGAACVEMEGAYQSAIRTAVKEVMGRPIAWYFLHVDTLSPRVLPRIMSLDRETGAGCVTMVSAGDDASWDTQFNMPSTIDSLITADGQAGRLVDLFRNESVISFHTHWQSLFSEGRATGLNDLRVTLGRIREHFGERVKWMKCSELAEVTVAQAVTRHAVVESETEITITLHSPIACPDFTATLHTDRVVHSVFIGGQRLKELPQNTPVLEAYSWSSQRGSVTWCADLPVGESVVKVS